MRGSDIWSVAETDCISPRIDIYPGAHRRRPTVAGYKGADFPLPASHVPIFIASGARPVKTLSSRAPSALCRAE